jgi:hypothetical protein
MRGHSPMGWAMLLLLCVGYAHLLLLLAGAATRLPARLRSGLPSAVLYARALVRLVCAWRLRRLRHVPTLGQLRSMARLKGTMPCSYLLDPEHNFVPVVELEMFGDEAQLGTQALAFRCRHPGTGWEMEMVALRHGGAFDLLGINS